MLLRNRLNVTAQYPVAIRKRLKTTVTIFRQQEYRYRERTTKGVDIISIQLSVVSSQ
ncbi:hypothetical protein KKE26_11445 [bacterium]|nr:hypothetical protein [bacterium]